MREKYILTDIEAKDILKEALGKRYSLYRRVSAVYRAGATDSKDFKQICDSVLQDIANVIGQPRTRQENDVPFTEEYPELVYDEIVRKAGPVEFRVDESFRDGEYVRILNFTLRNKVWRIAYRYRKLFSLEWDGEGVHNHVWNILSYGWSNYYKGTWVECMNPATAAELFLMMDDMTAYLREEVRELAYKVRQEILCRQVEMNSVLAAVKEAGFRYYRLWVNSTRTIALHVKLSGNREVDVTLYPRQINENLDVLIEDLKAAERGEPTVLRCRIHDAVGKWDVIQ